MVGKTCWLCFADRRGGGAGANFDEGIKSVDFLTSSFYSMTWAVAAKKHDKQRAQNDVICNWFLARIFWNSGS
jgi:hypothetical protein